ncbi:hypothetical protein L207DRAFT_586542 [Hyaloscypha variabilis F]|uniref:Uncharacterized protein n=1 Tax=Hyaloscypha variabilis (strain UAMH 11265 / GT02V1 / F) TaxID=1149755 RepID=A0A2J6RED2_HYAVF|nr:hypothetical protein L207DRAFT_586542 [Hyaloscypha variabilis F]
MKTESLLRLLIGVAPILSLAHALVPLEVSQIRSHPNPLPEREDHEPEVQAISTLFVYVTAPVPTTSSATSLYTSFVTVTTLAPVAPPPASTVIYTATEYWSIRIWPPWIRTIPAAVASPAPKA